MSDLGIDLSEAEAYIAVLPAVYKQYAQVSITSDNPAEIEEAALALTGENRKSGIIVSLGSSNVGKNSLWKHVIDEVADFFAQNLRSTEKSAFKVLLSFSL